MEIERIERALREGPPDEPIYQPGTFRREAPSRWWFAIAGFTVGIALVFGIVIGVGLDVLRSGRVGGEPAMPVLTAADLQGVWQSEALEKRAWVEELLARDFTQEQIDAFLAHDPFENRVAYTLRFVDSRIIVQATYDDLPLRYLGEGTFTIGQDGTLDYAEVVRGVKGTCGVVAAPEIDGAKLTFDVLDLPGCNPDERMANTLFFEIPQYLRAAD
jgi:hypothetical protein